jgi:hypothetical protein
MQYIFISYAGNEIFVSDETKFHYVDYSTFIMFRTIEDIYNIQSYMTAYINECSRDSAINTLIAENHDYVILVSVKKDTGLTYVPIKQILVGGSNE